MRAASKKILGRLKETLKNDALCKFLEDIRKLDDSQIAELVSAGNAKKEPLKRANPRQPQEATPASRVLHILLKDCKLSRALARDQLAAELKALTGTSVPINRDEKLEEWTASLFEKLEPATIMRAAMAIKYQQ
jgi:hypothetical protein